jgi:bifunctional non-homologous end joining protein LigD
MPVSRLLSPFIPPATPVLVDVPPLGPEWVHEVKWDGHRLQAHKVGDLVALFTRTGKDCTARYPRARNAIAALPCGSGILDCELVAMGAEREDFWRIRSREANLQLVCFDLMHNDGQDLRALPLIERKAVLRSLVSRARHPMLAYSDHFKDGMALLRKAEGLGLEGIVSKRSDMPYRSSSRCGWKKLKTAAWLKANANRPDVFAKLVKR